MKNQIKHIGLAATKRLTFVVTIALCLASYTIALGQSGGTTSNEYGGTTDIFDLAVGARAMALGGAYVTAADDPFALYWNPATLENVPAMSVGFYHSGLSGAATYDYVSFVYPTLSFGTLSAGLLRLSSGDIEARMDDASFVGTQDFSRSLYMVGYGKKVYSYVTLGGTIKIDHINMPGYPDDFANAGSYSESAVGGDLGLVVTSPLTSGALRNWLFGFNYQNMVRRTMQLRDKKESSPRNFRFGLSRKFYIGGGENHLLCAFEVDNPAAADVPNYYHFGGEFGFKNAFMLRLGYNKRGSSGDGYGMTYGMGVRYTGFQLDYSYWSGVDEFYGASHRLSFAADIGKTRSQRIAQRDSDEFERIQEEARKRLEIERNNTLFSGMSDARQYFENGEYPRAFSAINKVLALDETNEDPEFRDARELLKQINDAIEQQRKAAYDRDVAETQAAYEIRQKQQRIREHYDKAMAFWESEQFQEAIAECDRALEIDPNDKTVNDLRKMADQDLRNRIHDLLETASRLNNEGRTLESLQNYNRALPLARGNGFEEILSFIEGRINLLDGQLSYQNQLRRAVDLENAGQWKEAADIYQSALRSNPNNADLKKKYNEANARANATPMEMTPEVKRYYTLGVRAVRDEKYDEAIDYYQQALEQQPFNVTILNALDYARNQQRRASTSAAN